MRLSGTNTTAHKSHRIKNMTPTPFPPGSRLVAYLRDSGGREQDMSVQQQEQAIIQWAQSNGCILTNIYKDFARSGTKTAGRDQFIEMVNHLAGKVQEVGVLFWEYARLSRDYDDLMYYVADLRRQGYVIYSITDQVPDGLEGRLLESIIAWKNAKYIEDLRKNVKRGRRYLISAHGVLPGGNCPIGYRFEQVNIGIRRDGSPHVAPRLEPDPTAASLVARAFEMRANGATYQQIHEETHLYKWLETYAYLLRNEIYLGVLKFQDIRIENFCTPLIDQQTWDMAQLVNEQRKRRTSFNQPRSICSRFVLSGLLYCGVCGMHMHAHTNLRSGRTYEYYRCRSYLTGKTCGAKYLRKTDIESLVLSVFKNSILNADALDAVYQDAKRQRSALGDQNAVQLERDMQALSTVRSRIQRVTLAISEIGHSKALLEQLQDLERQEVELQGAVASAETFTLPLPDVDYNQVVAAARKALEIASEQEVATVLRGFIDRITANKNESRIVGKIEYHTPGIDTNTEADL